MLNKGRSQYDRTRSTGEELGWRSAAVGPKHSVDKGELIDY